MTLHYKFVRDEREEEHPLISALRGIEVQITVKEKPVPVADLKQDKTEFVMEWKCRVIRKPEFGGKIRP